MTGRVRPVQYEYLHEEGRVSKRRKTSNKTLNKASNLSQDSQASDTTLMSEEPWVRIQTAELMRV